MDSMSLVQILDSVIYFPLLHKTSLLWTNRLGILYSGSHPKCWTLMCHERRRERILEGKGETHWLLGNIVIGSLTPHSLIDSIQIYTILLILFIHLGILFSTLLLKSLNFGRSDLRASSAVFVVVGNHMRITNWILNSNTGSERNRMFFFRCPCLGIAKIKLIYVLRYITLVMYFSLDQYSYISRRIQLSKRTEKLIRMFFQCLATYVLEQYSVLNHFTLNTDVFNKNFAIEIS